jgi:histidine triad (HIT) family protein
MKRTPRCVFCEIAAERAPAARVFEDTLTIAFLDSAPAARGHVLVITREHFETLYELSAEAAQGVALTARRIARALRDALQPEGLSVIQSNGAAANQTEPHYHMHLIPRRRTEGLRTHGKGAQDPEALQELAAAIAQHVPTA